VTDGQNLDLVRDGLHLERNRKKVYEDRMSDAKVVQPGFTIAVEVARQ